MAVEARLCKAPPPLMVEPQQQQPRLATQFPAPEEHKRPAFLDNRSLLNMCIECLGAHLHDIIDDIHLVASVFPPSVKAKLVAIARRRGLLCDKLLVPLADEAWDVLDVSGSDVSDAGMKAVARVCCNLKAVDLSICSMLSWESITAFVQNCPALETLRCGGTLMSNKAAKSALPCILPRLHVDKEVEDSWEDVETEKLGEGAQSLQWIVWPSIDRDSEELVRAECPRLVINPKHNKLQPGLVPREALSNEPLDEHLVEELNPLTWAVMSRNLQPCVPCAKQDIPIAERFRLAFAARDERLAPKRAKNWRQSQRRAAKAWLNSDVDAKSRYMAAEVDVELA